MIFEIVGWLGTVLILSAYLLVTVKKVRSDSKEYQLMNLLGALGVIVNSFVHQALPSVGLNIVWLLIAIFGLAKSKKH